ncbi:MAG: ATP-binding protein [Candidatus Omnitrophica bacterium]|nr:ATP-binding protein [Candidatus Omnitrophota bacterium]
MKEERYTFQPDTAVFNTVFQYLPVPMFLLDEERRVSKMTPIAKEMFDNTLTERENSPFGRVVNCIHSLDDPRGCGFSQFCEDCSVKKFISDIYKTGIPCYRKEVKLTIGQRRRDCYLLISAEPIGLPSGRKVLLHFDDITDYKKSEERLQKERQRLKDTLEMLPVYVILFTPDYHIAFANRFFRERFGESGGKRCFEYLFGRSEPCQPCPPHKVLETNSSHTWEWLGPDGRSYSIFDFPFTDSDGSPLILEMGIDITDNKLAQEKLTLIKDNLDRAQMVAHIGSWHLDIINNILVWSDETYRIFGLDIGTPLTYDKFLSMVHPDDREYANKSWQAALRREPYDIEHRIVVQGKIKWVREKAQVEFDKRGKAVKGVGTVQDITELKHKEENFRKLQNELMRVSRVTTMGELTAALAHELNQPLMAILSNAQAAQRFLAEKKPDLGGIREILSDIIKDDRRASDVINKIRSLLKRSDFEFVVLDINNIIREVISLLHSEIVIRNVSLTCELDDKIPHVRGDRIQLQQVILNLVLNSFDAMKDIEHKELCIRTRQENGKFIVVSIRDAGTGIGEKVMPRIFDPFFTTKKESMGMGLAINKAIVESHGGSLWAENNPDKGATFYFTLPIAKENKGGKD